MTGCSAPTPDLGNLGAGGSYETPPVDGFCQVDKPITWSKRDTDQTITEVKTHNRVHTGLCTTTH